MVIAYLVLVFGIGLFVGLYRPNPSVTLCRDCLRKLPLRDSEEESSCGSKSC